MAYELLEPGTYEAVVKYAGEGATRAGNPCINLTMVLRNDVDQLGRNRYIWDSLYPRKPENRTEDDKKCEGYSAKRIASISKAASFETGTNFSTVQAWCEALKNCCLRITIEHETYNEKTREVVKWYNETKLSPCRHNFDGKAPEPAEKPKKVESKEEDVPF